MTTSEQVIDPRIAFLRGIDPGVADLYGMQTTDGVGMQTTDGLPVMTESKQTVPERLFGYLSLRSNARVTNGDAFRAVAAKSSDDAAQLIEPFRASAKDRADARELAQRAGLKVIAESDLGLSVSGPPEAFHKLTSARATTVEVLMRSEMGQKRYVTCVDLSGEPRSELGVALADPDSIEAVVLERPRLAYGAFPSPVPPPVTRFHLRVPDDVAVILGAQAAHRLGIIGDGVTVAMVDTGQYAHPFFLAHRYDVQPTTVIVPDTSPTRDPIGHGTGESANIFAVAPGARLLPYRATDDRGRLVGAMAGFMLAKSANPKPRVMTNSWGGDGPFPAPRGRPDAAERMFALEIADAIAKGIVVVFAGGNGQFSIEPQVPGVIAAGGAFVGPELDLTASDYASGYQSPWFDGQKNVPTVCGLVGMRPRAQYLLLPVEPGGVIDVAESRPIVDDSGDGTTAGDGWALFSGTSAAAPQVAGAAALLIGAVPGITPAQVTDALTKTATDITVGRCHPRFDQRAGVGHDVATGYGLINASAAVAYALERF